MNSYLQLGPRLCGCVAAHAAHVMLHYGRPVATWPLFDIPVPQKGGWPLDRGSAKGEWESHLL